MYVRRTIEDFLLRASARFPVVVVTGARQVGKTTMLRRIAEPQRTYVTLDDPLVLDIARRDPALFFQRFRPPLLVDEIQYAPKLLPHIKMLVDEERRPGMLWLTGSQQFHAMKGMSESLAGRVAIVRMLGLSLREALGLGDQGRPFVPDMAGILARKDQVPPVSLSDLYRRIWLGSLPLPSHSKNRPSGMLFSRPTCRPTCSATCATSHASATSWRSCALCAHVQRAQPNS